MEKKGDRAGKRRRISTYQYLPNDVNFFWLTHSSRRQEATARFHSSASASGPVWFATAVGDKKLQQSVAEINSSEPSGQQSLDCETDQPFGLKVASYRLSISAQQSCCVHSSTIFREHNSCFDAARFDSRL